MKLDEKVIISDWHNDWLVVVGQNWPNFLFKKTNNSQNNFFKICLKEQQLFYLIFIQLRIKYHDFLFWYLMIYYENISIKYTSEILFFLTSLQIKKILSFFDDYILTIV